MYFMVPYKAVLLGPSLVQGQLLHPQFKLFSIKYLVPTAMGPCAGYLKRYAMTSLMRITDANNYSQSLRH